MAADDPKKARIRAFVNTVTPPARIMYSHTSYTVFEVVLTREDFVQAATALTDEYVLTYAWTKAEEEQVNPPSYRYQIILQERNLPRALQWPAAFKAFINPNAPVDD
jgi:hypothetical protein